MYMMHHVAQSANLIRYPVIYVSIYSKCFQGIVYSECYQGVSNTQSVNG
jgi:hypothetical protein